MDEKEAVKRGTLAVLVRNQQLIQWYVERAFSALSPTQINLFFWALSKFDKSGQVTRENFWALIPHFLSILDAEQFCSFVADIQEIWKLANVEIIEYLPANGTAYDHHRTNRIGENDSSNGASATGNDEAYSRGNSGYQRGEDFEQLPLAYGIGEDKE